MLDIIKKYLRDNDWKFSQVDNKDVLLFGIAGDNGNFQCVFDIEEQSHRFVFYSICGTNVPKDKMSIVLELLNKINYTVFFGNLEMDTEDGEIRFRTSIDYEFLTLNEQLIEKIIMPNIVAMDDCLPGVMGLIYGGLTLQQAYDLATKSQVTDKKNE
jgi:hypothetical protein